MRIIDNIDPRLKLAWAVAAIVSAFLLKSIVGEVILIALLFLLEWSFTRSLKNFKILTLVMLLVATQLAIIQLLFNREGILLWQWWIIKVYSGAIPAAALGFLRTSALAYAGVQFISWTSALDATLMLRSWHLPYRYAMLVGVAARFFPLMQKEYTAISQSQTVRGLPTEGFWNKVKAMPPTMFPLMYRALRRASDTALSMELRGFGRAKERTFTKSLSLSRWEIIGIIFLLLYTLAFIIYTFIIK